MSLFETDFKFEFQWITKISCTVILKVGNILFIFNEYLIQYFPQPLVPHRIHSTSRNVREEKTRSEINCK